MEPKTEREYLIKIDTNVTVLTNIVNKLSIIVEKLEDVKLKEMDKRISDLETKVEKQISEKSGAGKFANWIAIAISTIVALYTSLKS